MLEDAARYIDSVCAIAERDVPASHDVSGRLAEFNFSAITCSLDELAAELRALAVFITASPWEETEHLCGYSVAAADVQPEVCYHQSCWTESESIGVALAMQIQARRTLEQAGFYRRDEEDS
jgi:hypothetical protein